MPSSNFTRTVHASNCQCAVCWVHQEVKSSPAIAPCDECVPSSYRVLPSGRFELAEGKRCERHAVTRRSSWWKVVKQQRGTPYLPMSNWLEWARCDGARAPARKDEDGRASAVAITPLCNTGGIQNKAQGVYLQ